MHFKLWIWILCDNPLFITKFNNALHVFERFRKMVQVYLQNVFVAKIVMSQLLNPEILSEHVLPLPTNQRRYLVNILCTF